MLSEEVIKKRTIQKNKRIFDKLYGDTISILENKYKVKTLYVKRIDIFNIIKNKMKENDIKIPNNEIEILKTFIEMAGGVPTKRIDKRTHDNYISIRSILQHKQGMGIVHIKNKEIFNIIKSQLELSNIDIPNDKNELLELFIDVSGGKPIIKSTNKKIIKHGLTIRYNSAKRVLKKMGVNVPQSNTKINTLLIEKLIEKGVDIKDKDESVVLDTFFEIFGKVKKYTLKNSEKCETPHDFYSSDDWRQLRLKVFDVYDRKCCCCGRTPKHGVILHVDHIKPRSKYPELELDFNNLQILCEDCNIGKLNLIERDFRE